MMQWTSLIPFFIYCINGYFTIISGIQLQYEECEVGTSLISNSNVTYPVYDNNPERPDIVHLEDPAEVWRAFFQSTNQFLVVDFRSLHIVTQFKTWGRLGENEYVKQYAIEYSTDNKDWMEYTNEFGFPEVFKGNNDSENVAENTLQYPIIARYIKFKVVTFRRGISMKVDVMGCPYEPDSIQIANGGHIVYHVDSPQFNTTDVITLRFRTTHENGVLLYGSRDGEFNDVILLELRHGELHFKMELMSPASPSGITDVSGGRFLNDGIWHDVIFTRNGSRAKLIVDRREIEFMIKRRFIRFKPSGKIFIGGVDNPYKKGLSMNSEHFNGCIDRFRYNGINIIRNAKEKIPGYSPSGPIAFTCYLEAEECFTFTTNSSYLLYEVEAEADIRVGFEFKTNHKNANIFRLHEGDDWVVQLETDGTGFLQYTVTYRGGVYTDTVKKVDIHGNITEYTDGLWHTFNIHVNKTNINTTVDGYSRFTNKDMDIPSSPLEFLFGTDNISKPSFFGCLRNINIGSMPENNRQYRYRNLVTTGPCVIKDRCTPNPCEHNGKCMQNGDAFHCDCGNTGYIGAFCHISAHPLSCAVYYSMFEHHNRTIEDITIDPDGSGPVTPFIVGCNNANIWDIVETSISHDVMEPVTVDGFQEPNYYSRKIRYTAELDGLSEVIDRSDRCRQMILWKCNNSRLMFRAIDSVFKTYGYWVGRTNQDMFYWGGSAPESYKCACGVSDEGCIMGSTTCNCDSYETGTQDGGYLTQKRYLPVMELYFGDTGTLADNKIGQYTLGKLTCEGESLLDNTVTFRKEDSTLKFAPFKAGRAGDIWFQFKTTSQNGVLIHNIDETNDTFIKIELKDGFIVLSYTAGIVLQKLSYKKYVSNDMWHTVHVERNLKQAYLRIDNFNAVYINEPADTIPLHLDLTKPLVVGATVDYKNGFVGCVRGLRVNGVLQDMRGAVHNGQFTYGVHEGCVGKCTSSPCFNDGRCVEGYSQYTCDCTNTPFTGRYCSKEVGVHLRTNYMIRFDTTKLSQYLPTTLLKVGFITNRKQGILLHLSDEHTYVSLVMNNNGGVKFDVNFGFERFELNTWNMNVDFSNGQPHIVTLRRENYRILHLQVDEYPEAVTSLDHHLAQMFPENYKYLYIGSNDTSIIWKGFEGCIYHVEIDGVFPLKTAFEVPKPDSVTFDPNGVMEESTCGHEEVTHAPEPEEVRVIPLENLPRPTCGHPVPSPGFDRGGKHIEDGDLFFTLPRQDIDLNEKITGLLTMTCRVTSPNIHDVIYILIRQETSPKSDEFECLAMIGINRTQTPMLNDQLNTNKSYVVNGTLNKTMATYLYLSIGMDVLNLTCEDAKDYMCEVGYKNSSSETFETASTIGTILASAGCETQEKLVAGGVDDSLDTGTRVGIAVGVIGGVVLVVILIFVVCKYRKRSKQGTYDQQANIGYSASFTRTSTE